MVNDNYREERQAMKHSRAERMGFTLIEVLLVIAILVVLGTVSVVAYTGIRERAMKDASQAQVDQTAHAVKLYETALNKLPETDEGLNALITKPDDEKEAERWGKPFLENAKIPVDPWGNELKYETLDNSDGTGPGFRIFSYGPDRQEGTDDDISSYKEDSGN